MPERLKAILDKITAWWKKFNTKQRSVLISIVSCGYSGSCNTWRSHIKTYTG